MEAPWKREVLIILDEEPWRINRSVENKLLGEYEDISERSVGMSDGEKREGMRASVQDSIGVVGTHAMEKMISEVEKGDWHPVNIGKTYVSGNTVFNLFGAVSARKKGLGTHIPIGGGDCYLFDESGRRYYMKEEHHQLRFKARLYSSDGKYKEIELIHDTGAAATIRKR